MKRMIALTAVVVAALAMLSSGAPAGAQSGARIHLIHGIPDTPVDVAAGGENVFTDFDFGDTQDLSALAGQTLDRACRSRPPAPTPWPSTPATWRCRPGQRLDHRPPRRGGHARPSRCSPTTRAPSPPARAAWWSATPRRRRPSTSGPTGPWPSPTSRTRTRPRPTCPPARSRPTSCPPGRPSPSSSGPPTCRSPRAQTLIVYAVGSLDGGTLQTLTETIGGSSSAPSAVDTGNSPVSDGSSTPLAAWALAGLAGAAAVTVAGRRVRATRR